MKIIEQVCAALSYAHDRDIVHRDVKPANVIVQPDGNAKLLDFGIARLEKRDRDLNLTLTGNIIGTVLYMAPERLKGAQLDGRSDIFAAGVMLYQRPASLLPRGSAAAGCCSPRALPCLRGSSSHSVSRNGSGESSFAACIYRASF